MPGIPGIPRIPEEYWNTRNTKYQEYRGMDNKEISGIIPGTWNMSDNEVVVIDHCGKLLISIRGNKMI